MLAQLGDEFGKGRGRGERGEKNFGDLAQDRGIEGLGLPGRLQLETAYID